MVSCKVAMKRLQKFMKKNPVVCVFLILVTICFVYMFVKTFIVKEHFNIPGLDNQRGGEEQFKGGQVPTFYFFNVDWCGHCKRAKPEWSKFQELLDDKNQAEFNGKKVQLRSVNCEGSEEEQALAKEYGVEGFPTFILQKGDEKINYDGPRTFDAMKQWLAETN